MVNTIKCLIYFPTVRLAYDRILALCSCAHLQFGRSTVYMYVPGSHQPLFPICWQYLVIYNVCSSGTFGFHHYSSDLDLQPPDPQNMQIRRRASLFNTFQHQPRKLWHQAGKTKRKRCVCLRIINWVSFFEANKNPKFFISSKAHQSFLCKLQ